ncbi:MAG: hypothetical protein E6R04_05520 [Spirochaetes bacterium]|nr:MAG: hypothetical protein E6R04_05520 [Spirochaetota bacterium]
MKIGVWYEAEEGEKVTDSKTGKPGVKSKLGRLAYRPGWHAGDYPFSTHIGIEPKPSEISGRMAPSARADNQVWAEVEMPADFDWQEVADSRAEKIKSGPKKGQIRPDTAHITDQIPKGGHYRYKTNPNMQGKWIIGGAMKIIRVLSDEEVEKINSSAGYKDLPRKSPMDLKKLGFSIDASRVGSNSKDFWYHTTTRKNLERIATEGLKTNSPSNYSIASLEYMKDAYGVVPIFLAKSSKPYEDHVDSVILKIDTRGLDLVADIPTLASHFGAYVEEDHIWFESDDRRAPRWGRKEDSIPFEELINGSFREDAIKTTGTCAVLQNIPPNRIKILKIKS